MTLVTEGATLGPWRLSTLLGSGSFGVVYSADHQKLPGLRAAIKILHPQWALNHEHKKRFLIEAQIVSKAQHPNVVQVLDGEVPDHDHSPCWLAMELLKGQTLEDLIEKEGALSPQRTLRLAKQVLSALQTAHAEGIVHRDLKPANIFITSQMGTDGELLKVLDFGVAKLREQSQGRKNATITGTPAYMSPEQFNGEPDIDGRADLYSLGVILFECLTGRQPYQGASVTQMAVAHIQKPVPDPRALVADLPRELATLVMSMMSKERAGRPEDATAAGARVDALLRGLLPLGPPHPSARRLRGPLLAAGLCLVAGAGVYLVAARPWAARHAPPAETSLPEKAAPLPAEVPLPGGTFTMGSTPAQIDSALALCQRISKDCRRDLFAREDGARQVTVSPFLLDRREVTNEEFARFLNQQRGLRRSADNRYVLEGEVPLHDLHPSFGGIVPLAEGYAVRSGSAKMPVVQVSWDAAQRYCAAQQKRLPTEAEWEYAARGAGPGRTFPWGDEPPSCGDAVFGRMNGLPCLKEGLGPGEAGKSRIDRTPEGIEDLGGNVQEWTADRYAAPYAPCQAPCLDPRADRDRGDPAGAYVVRGGSFLYGPDAMRGAGRSQRQARVMQSQIGFRCARSVGGAEKK